MVTLRMTAWDDFRRSGRNVVVVWISPKKLGSKAARTTAMSTLVAFWGLSKKPAPSQYEVCKVTW